MDKERLRQLDFIEKLFQTKEWSAGPRPVGGNSVNGLFQNLSKLGHEHTIWLEVSDRALAEWPTVSRAIKKCH